MGSIVLGATGAILAAVGVCAWGAIAPGSQLFGRTLRRTGDVRAMALTFDDGPNPAVTPQLLDLLDRFEIRATFFLIGKHVRACPALGAEIAARGHALGNHTETHPHLSFLSSGEIAEELAGCGEAIETATGRTPVWMRPPFGFRGPQLPREIRRAKLRGVAMWSVWAWDWKPQPAEPVIHRLRRVRGGDIVVLHDGDHRKIEGDRGHILGALEYWLPRWRDAGLKFVTLDSIGAASESAGN
ncbi:MAG: polysaccharide deacetylase family protein [Candidatus Acidiferrales bacterium]